MGRRKSQAITVGLVVLVLGLPIGFLFLTLIQELLR